MRRTMTAVLAALLVAAPTYGQDTTDTPSAKQVRQRAGWMVDRIENLLEEVEASLEHARRLEAMVDSIVVRDSLRALETNTAATDTTATDTTETPPDDTATVAVEPAVAFDPDQYDSTQDLRDDPAGVFDTRSDVQLDRIFLDSLGMRYDWVDQGADNAISIGRRVPLPENVRELWVEMEVRWSANFMSEIDMSRTETYAHKMFFLETKAFATDPNWETSGGQSVYRWSLHWPGGGATNPPHGQIKVETPATESGANVDKNIGVDGAGYFDGRWHTVRLHVRHDPGLYEMWIDGDRVLALDGFTVHPEVVITALLLGRNKDDGNLSGTESLWWGKIRAWASNPGW